jgi:hypothetical protein
MAGDPAAGGDTMSARLICGDGPEAFEVVLREDGTLWFVDEEAAEYEVAFVAMGGDDTARTKLLDAWARDPIELIVGISEPGFQILHRDLCLITADWAEHVLPLYSHEFAEDDMRLNIALFVVVAGRQRLLSGRGDSDLRQLVVHLDHIIEVGAFVPGQTISVTAKRAGQAISYFGEIASPDMTMSTSVVMGMMSHKAQEAYAFHLGLSPADEHHGAHEAWQLALQEERSWQVRHAIHVLSALQAGKPWPKIEETP